MASYIKLINEQQKLFPFLAPAPSINSISTGKLQMQVIIKFPYNYSILAILIHCL